MSPPDTRRALERLLCLDGPRVTVEASVSDGPPTWLHRDDWRVYARPAQNGHAPGTALATFLLEGGGATALRHAPDVETLFLPFDLDEAYHNYISEKWTRAGVLRRLSSRQLRLFYVVKHLIPRPVQLRARRRLIRWQGKPQFPSWPLDTSVSRLLELYAFCVLRLRAEQTASFRWFWPDGFHAACVLSHDVEGAEGLRLAVELADLEEDLGFRSCFNVGGWYDLDPGVFRELTSRGFEIGIHGLVHDRSLFSSRSAFEAQLPELRMLAERTGATGFRSPATHRVFAWMHELPVEYDGTIPNSDPYEPQPGGCCSIWPFFIGSLVELPYTLPQDHTLLTLLGHRNADVWIEGARRIEDGYGLIQCLSHPDRGYLGDPPKRAIYAEFLRAIAERERVWKALPRDVASWWRERDAAGTVSARTRAGSIRADDGAAAGVLSPPD